MSFLKEFYSAIICVWDLNSMMWLSWRCNNSLPINQNMLHTLLVCLPDIVGCRDFIDALCNASKVWNSSIIASTQSANCPAQSYDKATSALQVHPHPCESTRELPIRHVIQQEGGKPTISKSLYMGLFQSPLRPCLQMVHVHLQRRVHLSMLRTHP